MGKREREREDIDEIGAKSFTELLLLGLNEIQLDLNNPCNQNVSLLLVLLIKLIVVVQPQLQIL